MKVHQEIAKHAKANGLHQVDATTSLALEVTDADIRKAKPKDPQCCAFACAVKRGLGAKAAYFLRTTAWVEYDDRIVRYVMPVSMQKEIVAFDRARAMEPGVYQLSSPGPAKRGSTRRRRYKARVLAKAKRQRASRAARTGTVAPAAKPSPKNIKHETTNIRTILLAQ